MMWLFPLGMVSMSVTARTLIFPRPVRYASSMPLVPRMVAAVGKSGPLMMESSSSMVVSRFSSTLLSMIFTTAAITSRRLWGGILVAMPTAMPVPPLTRRFGNLDGRTTGSFSVSSKLGTKSTVSL